MKKLLLVLLSSQIVTLTLGTNTLLIRTGVRTVSSNDLASLLALIKLPTPDAPNSRCFSRADVQRYLGFKPTERFAFKRSAGQKRVTQTISKL